jgi:hypothetical protein
MVCFNAAV